MVDGWGQVVWLQLLLVLMENFKECSVDYCRCCFICKQILQFIWQDAHGTTVHAHWLHASTCYSMYARSNLYLETEHVWNTEEENCVWLALGKCIWYPSLFMGQNSWINSWMWEYTCTWLRSRENPCYLDTDVTRRWSQAWRLILKYMSAYRHTSIMEAFHSETFYIYTFMCVCVCIKLKEEMAHYLCCKVVKDKILPPSPAMGPNDSHLTSIQNLHWVLDSKHTWFHLYH